MIHWLILLAILNAAYVAALPSATVFYVANVLLHLALGAATVVWLAWRWRRNWRVVPLLLALVTGLALMKPGVLIENRWLLYTHIALAVSGLAIVVPMRWRASIAVLTLASAGLRFGLPEPRIRNPRTVPISMNEEGAGPNSPFFPSSANTNTGGLIPSDFFMDSKLCGECHKDIYEQWNSSVHHFASFNNQFYRRSIEHMQELSGTKGSKWCAGCHDHAVFFNGRFDRPIVEQVNTPEAQNGLGCVSCHSIVNVDSSMGNGGFTIEYPPLHPIMASRNPWIRQMDYFVTYLNPAPHKKTFMKAFMRKDSSEYCSTCHKVHLDVPVNNYRWLRGFNEYDAWQASGVSGQGARSFYYPEKSSTCTDCHMPLVPSRDPGNHSGMVHSHRFPAANMAVAYVNKDHEQMKITEAFLKSGFITVDLFAATPVEDDPAQPRMIRRVTDSPAIASTFAVGEEAEMPGNVMIREVGKIAAPLDAPGVQFRPGTTVRVDAVVRTRKIGHFFPAGTVDSFDVWLEFIARDARGKVLAWSGRVEGNGRGPVEKGAHFYRAFLLDAKGNPIDKRNAWQARSLLYVRLIPPGAADTVHFRVSIPPDAVGPVTLEAKLNYRKFSEFYTKYAFAGVAKPGPAGLDHDSREYTFDKPYPNLPIVTMAAATAKLELGEAQWKPVVRKQDRERWNDWGIGLLLQGDLKGAEYAFHRVTEAEPDYADGWLNIGRALIQEGQTEEARPFVMKALQLKPGLARANFFLGLIQKAAGDYDAALQSFSAARAQYPRDRVVLNQIGRILFLQRKYAEAITTFEATLTVDPEDVQAHYNLMLCYRGMGRSDLAEREEKLFRRFKADEASQVITAKPRMLSPEDNNERQPIHDHVSDPGARAVPAIASGGQ